MVADYTAGGETFNPRTPRVWSDRRINALGGVQHLALAPDGQRFAAFPLPEPLKDGQNRFHITFLLNFSDELRRRMLAK